MRDTLLRGCDAMGIDLTPRMVEQFEAFTALLLEWNARFNLTRITAPEDIAVRHYLDSLSLLSRGDALPPSARCIDVGTGAGFPAVPLAIVRPDTRWTLLDALRKRVAFLDAVIAELGIPAEARHGRAEDAARLPDMRDAYDLATARAVAALPTLCEWVLPFARVGGAMAAYRGKDADAELRTALPAIQALGGVDPAIFPAQVPFADLSHHILLVKKRAKTHERYPRRPKLPETQPILA